jgi:hypothetical protein
MRCSGIVLVLVTLTALARAEPSENKAALLQLDADARLEIYGQPVASEIARALVAGGIDVVVVGPKMAVPEHARLIVDGSIKTKGEAVALAIRIRNPRDGTTIDKLDATASSLGTIDRAAAELSARVLPVVRDKLAALEAAPPVDPLPKPKQPSAAPLVLPAMLVGLTVRRTAPRSSEPLRDALGARLAGWAVAGKRAPTLIDAASIAKLDPASIGAARVERAVAFEILDYGVELDRDVPMARARVRVWIATAKGVQFDRVIHTDTIVGHKGMQPDELAARSAREVLAILRPHMRRLEPTWP